MLANLVEHQLAVADRAGPVSHWEWLHAIDNLPVHEHFSLLRYLKKEDLALVSAPVAVGELFNEKDAAFLVKLDFTVHEIGHEDLHGLAAGLLRNLVDDFLWEGMKQQRAVSFPRTDDCVQGLAPATPVLLLSISPSSNDRPQGLKFLAGPLLVGVDGTPGGVAPGTCFVPGCLVIPVGLIFSLGFPQGFIQSLFFLDEFSDLLSVNAVHQAAFLGHFPREMLVGNQPVEVGDWQLRGKEVFDFLPREVIEIPDLVGGQDFNMHRHIADPFLALQLQPRRRWHLLADLGDELLVYLSAPLETVQGMLQFIDELVGFSPETGGVTGGLQIGY